MACLVIGGGCLFWCLWCLAVSCLGYVVSCLIWFSLVVWLVGSAALIICCLFWVAWFLYDLYCLFDLVFSWFGYFFGFVCYCLIMIRLVLIAWCFSFVCMLVVLFADLMSAVCLCLLVLCVGYFLFYWFLMCLCLFSVCTRFSRLYLSDVLDFFAFGGCFLLLRFVY